MDGFIVSFIVYLDGVGRLGKFFFCDVCLCDARPVATHFSRPRIGLMMMRKKWSAVLDLSVVLLCVIKISGAKDMAGRPRL